MRTNIAAFTPCDNYRYYPAFISINEEDEVYEIIIRSDEASGPVCSSIKLSRKEAIDIASSFFYHFIETNSA